MELTDKTKRNLIASYVNGTLKAEDIAKVEGWIGESPIYRSYFEKKKLEREFVLQMVPQEKLKINQKRSLSTELFSVTQEIFGREKVSPAARIKRFLDKPVITIRY